MWFVDKSALLLNKWAKILQWSKIKKLSCSFRSKRHFTQHKDINILTKKGPSRVFLLPQWQGHGHRVCCQSASALIKRLVRGWGGYCERTQRFRHTSLHIWGKSPVHSTKNQERRWRGGVRHKWHNISMRLAWDYCLSITERVKVKDRVNGQNVEISLHQKEKKSDWDTHFETHQVILYLQC